MNRRCWMMAAIGGTIRLIATKADEPTPALVSSSEELDAIREHAKKVGLTDIRSSKFAFYVGIGDAPDGFRTEAMQICHDLATVYLKHFGDRGFAVEAPKKELIVVTLKDRSSYEAFSENAPGANVGGHYDLETNALVVFDFRGDGQRGNTNAKRINTFTLVHEALHQLTYNTGLLDRQADIPACISEGLATYGELWQSSAKRAPFGRVNARRLSALTSLIPIEKLLTNDDLLNEADTEQVAYSESWLLVHYLMRPENVRKFQAYLAALRARRDPQHRLEDARTHLGDLDRLEANLKRHKAKSR